MRAGELLLVTETTEISRIRRNPAQIGEIETALVQKRPLQVIFSRAQAAIEGDSAGSRGLCIKHGNMDEPSDNFKRCCVISDSPHKLWLRRLNSPLLLLLICGCFSPMHTRLPTFWTGYADSEGMAYQQQDPFPDPDIGPDIYSRPLGFERPRTQERRAAEQRMFQGLPSVPEAIPRGYPRGGLSAPRTVN